MLTLVFDDISKDKGLLEASLHAVNRCGSTEISLSLSTDGVAFTG